MNDLDVSASFALGMQQLMCPVPTGRPNCSADSYRGTEPSTLPVLRESDGHHADADEMLQDLWLGIPLGSPLV